MRDVPNIDAILVDPSLSSQLVQAHLVNASLDADAIFAQPSINGHPVDAASRTIAGDFGPVSISASDQAANGWVHHHHGGCCPRRRYDRDPLEPAHVARAVLLRRLDSQRGLAPGVEGDAGGRWRTWWPCGSSADALDHGEPHSASLTSCPVDVEDSVSPREPDVVAAAGWRLSVAPAS